MVFRDTTSDGTVRLTGGSVGGGGEPGPPGEPGAPGAPGTNGTNGIDGEIILPFQANGILVAKVWPTAAYVSRSGNYRFRATCRDRGTGADLIVNVHINGSAALSGANRPLIVAGSGLGSDQANVTIALTAGEFVTGIEVEQVGNGWSTLDARLIKE